MNWLARFAACMLMLLMVADAQAQDYMPLSVEIYPGAGLSDAPSGTIPGDMQVAFYKIGVGYGLPIDLGATRLTLGARYEYLHVDLLDSDGFFVASPDNLHYVRLDLRLWHRLSQRWALVLGAAPGIASDFDEIGSDDVRFLGNVLVTHRASRDLLYGVGVAYTSDFGTPLVLPLIKVNWHSPGRLTFDGLLPLYAYLGYAVSVRSEIGLTASVSGTQYNINLDGADVLVPGAPDDIDLPAKYSVITVGPTYKQRIRGPFFVSVETGITVRRRFEFDGDVINTSMDQDPSAYFRAGLALRPGTN